MVVLRNEMPRKSIMTGLQYAEDQVESLAQMVGRDAPCEDVLVQLAELRAVLEDVAAILIRERFRQMIQVAFEAESTDAAVRECCAVMKYAKR
jgi:DNA-binding FrmR family transcriptional regulator